MTTTLGKTTELSRTELRAKLDLAIEEERSARKEIRSARFALDRAIAKRRRTEDALDLMKVDAP